MPLSNPFIERYILSAIHLYGVVTVLDLQTTIFYYTNESLTREKIEDVIRDLMLKHEEVKKSRHYYYNDDYISQEEVPYFYTQIQSRYSFYRPEKLEFLRYVSKTYFELTASIKDFKNYLIKELKMSVYQGENALRQTVFNIQASVDQQEVLEDLKLLLGEDKYHPEVLLMHIQKMKITTRLTVYRGHSVVELKAKLNKKVN